MCRYEYSKIILPNSVKSCQIFHQRTLDEVFNSAPCKPFAKEYFSREFLLQSFYPDNKLNSKIFKVATRISKTDRI